MHAEEVTCPNKLKSACIFPFIIHPSEHLKRIRENPKIILPLILVTFFTIVGVILAAQGIDIVENDPELLQMSEAELGIFLLITQTMFAFIGLMTPIITIFLSTVILFIIAKFVKSTVSFRQVFAMCTFVFIVDAIGILVNGIGLMIFGEIHGEDTVFTSINVFFGKDGWLGAVLNIFDVFTIWSYMLVWKGLRIVASFSVRARVIVIVLFIVIQTIGFLLI